MGHDMSYRSLGIIPADRSPRVPPNEHGHRPDSIADLAPPLESEAQLIMDGLLRECLKREPSDA